MKNKVKILFLMMLLFSAQSLCAKDQQGGPYRLFEPPKSVAQARPLPQTRLGQAFMLWRVLKMYGLWQRVSAHLAPSVIFNAQ